VLPPALTNTLFSHIAKLALAANRRSSRGCPHDARERVVFDLIADGLSNKEIAERLHLATNTVKGHVHNILEKLALHTRLQIAAYARSAVRSVRSLPPRRAGPFSLHLICSCLQKHAHLAPTFSDLIRTSWGERWLCHCAAASLRSCPFF